MRWLVLSLTVALLSACAMSPENLAYRDRLEGGFSTREDMVRFKTPDRERDALVADASTAPEQPVQAKDLQLLQAARNGNSAEIKALLASGAQVNAADDRGNTALLYAAQDGGIDTVQLLLRSGALVNGRGGAMTPLAAAALRGHTMVVRMLVRNRADADAVGENGLSPLMNAVTLDRQEVAKLLIEAGANTKVMDRGGDNLLTVCVNKNYPDMLAMLLHMGVKPDLRDANGLTPLYWAQYLERPALTDLLRKAGADEGRKKTELVLSRPYSFGEF